MDELLKIIAVVTGLLALLKGVLDIVKDYRGKDENSPSLWHRRRFRIGAVLVSVGVIAIIATSWLVIGRSENVVTVQISEISSFDQPGSILASEKFTSIHRGGISNEMIQNASRWIVEQMEQRHNLHLEEIPVTIKIPDDLAKDDIQINTTAPVTLRNYLYLYGGGSKGRFLLEQSKQTLQDLRNDFSFEVSTAGYTPAVVKVKWGEEMSKEILLKPQPIRLGIKVFTGKENNFATKLSHTLTSNNRFSIMDPKNLERVREEIKQQYETLRKYPEAQMSIRTIALDYMVSGNYERK